MNEAKITSRKLQMARLGFFPVGLSRSELQKEWEKLVEEGKVPALLRGMVLGEDEMRRRHKGRPGRKNQNVKCINCNSRLGEYHNHGLCNKCMSKQDATKTMHIPKMSRKV